MLLLPLSLLFIANVNAYTCPQQPIVVKYQAQEYFFPAQGSDDHYGTNQHCTWRIQIPDGYYATIKYAAHVQPRGSKKSDELDVKTTCGTFEFSQNYTYNMEDVRETTCDQFQMDLECTQNGTFHFNVTWAKNDPPVQGNNAWMQPYEYNVFQAIDLNEPYPNTISIQTEDKDMQFSVLADCTIYGNDFITGVEAYDGPIANTSMPHQSLQSEYDIRSTQHAITLYNAIQKDNLWDCLILINDVRNVDQFGGYSFYNVENNQDDPVLIVPPNPTKPYAITLSHATYDHLVIDYVDAVPAFPNTIIYGYNGVPSPDKLGTPYVMIDGNQAKIFFESNTVTLVMFKEGKATFRMDDFAMRNATRNGSSKGNSFANKKV